MATGQRVNLHVVRSSATDVNILAAGAERDADEGVVSGDGLGDRIGGQVDDLERVASVVASETRGTTGEIAAGDHRGGGVIRADGDSHRAVINRDLRSGRGDSLPVGKKNDGERRIQCAEIGGLLAHQNRFALSIYSCG